MNHIASLREQPSLATLLSSVIQNPVIVGYISQIRDEGGCSLIYIVINSVV